MGFWSPEGPALVPSLLVTLEAIVLSPDADGMKMTLLLDDLAMACIASR